MRGAVFVHAHVSLKAALGLGRIGSGRSGGDGTLPLYLLLRIVAMIIFIVVLPLLFPAVYPAPLAHILRYGELDDPIGVT